MFDHLLPAWQQEVRAGGARQRRINNHPLPLYFGSSASSKPIFFLITDEEPDFPTFADVVSVDQGRREDGKWTLVLTLNQPELADSFMGLCLELARRSAASSRPSTARSIFFATLRDWKNLLSPGKKRRLSAEALRGVVAELWFAVHYLSLHIEATAALIAWQGPYGAPQDFQIANGDLFEVKSTHSGSRRIRVSSVDQLDPPEGGQLTLCLVIADDVPANTLGSHTLARLIAEFEDLLRHDRGSLEDLAHRMDAIGVDRADPFYGEKAFAVSGLRSHPVTDGFPRVERRSVPLGVGPIKYDVSLSAIAAFEQTRDNS
jgi:hypothetical protein